MFSIGDAIRCPIQIVKKLLKTLANPLEFGNKIVFLQQFYSNNRFIYEYGNKNTANFGGKSEFQNIL